MSLQLILLALAAMVGLAALRLGRVRMGLTPLPEGRERTVFLIAFVAVPPVVLGLLMGGAAGGDPLRGVAWIPLYAVILAGLAVMMLVAALVAQYVGPVRSRRFLLLALAGSEGDPDDLPFDPPVTARLAADMAVVDRTNLAFPRGLEFPSQVERADFNSAWDALDAATGTLEGRIADDRRLGLGVALAAIATATDARGRLDTLRGIAVSRGLGSVSG